MSAKSVTVPKEIGLDGSVGPRLVVEAAYRDEKTNALYVHQDLVQVVKPWEVEAHVGPVRAAEKFGDVESWVAYVQRFAGHEEFAPHLTWNARGFWAVLDYHDSIHEPGRCQWTAACPFVLSPEWRRWTEIAGGRPVAHRAAVEMLEDLAADIVEPAAADLASLLRSLRATVNASAETDLRPDGTARVSFSEDKKVGGREGIDVPPEFTIAIRALVGHADAEGRPVRYKLPVRVRVSVGDDARLAFRFALPTAERVLEDVYADRVARTKELLGEGFSLLRAAD